MIKTLRITSVLVALAAIAFVIFIAATGLSADEKIEELLKTPGLARRLQAGSATSKKERQEQESALVRQAKAFALRINPPAAAKTVGTKKTRRTPIRPKVAEVSAKFEVVGTSYYPLNPANSWVLINEVGKGWHWVKQGEKVGHLTIREVADGYVVIDDGKKTYELAPKRAERMPMPAVAPANAEGEKMLQSFIEAVEAPQQSEPPEQTKKKLEKNIEWLKSLSKDGESIGLGDEEVNGLGDLGDMLNSLEKELALVESNSIDDTNGVTDVNNARDSKKTEEDPRK
ncbi:MAG: hypothetical protein GWO86_00280 [Planctomycetes bacterium]|nr:hypothetical protein [Planctomycetota bacterium]